MTLDDITLVQQSFSRITRIREEAARIFYADLFATAPEVRPYFASTDMSKQGVKLLATLAVVVAGLNDLGAVLNTARKLARNHLDYGVQAEDYAKVGASLIRMLDTTLGQHFTPEVKGAWIEAYTMLANVMIDTAYARQPPGAPRDRDGGPGAAQAG